MKRTWKFLFIAALFAAMFTSCDDEADPVLPTAGFTFAPAEIVVYDVVTFTNTTVEGVTYAWSFGDESVSTDESPTHMYTAAGTYTVTLTATNADGDNIATQDITVGAIVNTYKMSYYSDSELEIIGDAYWFSSMGAAQIRLDGSLDPAHETPNNVKITPEMGIDPLYGTGTRTYTWDGSGDVDTYDASFTHYPETGEVWDAAWMMSTVSGEGLEVTLVYDAADDKDDIYDIKMMNTSFNGFYDATYSFQTADGVLSLNYRGKITPLDGK